MAPTISGSRILLQWQWLLRANGAVNGVREVFLAQKITPYVIMAENETNSKKDFNRNENWLRKVSCDKRSLNHTHDDDDFDCRLRNKCVVQV